MLPAPQPVLPGPGSVLAGPQSNGDTSNSGTCGKGYVGGGTYYYAKYGYTACGERFNEDALVAAISWKYFINTPNPNNSPSCRKCA